MTQYKWYDSECLTVNGMTQEKDRGMDTMAYTSLFKPAFLLLVLDSLQYIPTLLSSVMLPVMLQKVKDAKQAYMAP